MKDKLEKLPIYSTIKPSVHFRMDKKELTDPQSILTNKAQAMFQKPEQF
jgi:hypothetical protein